MPDQPTLRVWSKSVPSLTHPDRDEDLAWTAANEVAYAAVDGMGSARRKVVGGEIGG